MTTGSSVTALTRTPPRCACDASSQLHRRRVCFPAIAGSSPPATWPNVARATKLDDAAPSVRAATPGDAVAANYAGATRTILSLSFVLGAKSNTGCSAGFTPACGGLLPAPAAPTLRRVVLLRLFNLCGVSRRASPSPARSLWRPCCKLCVAVGSNLGNCNLKPQACNLSPKPCNLTPSPRNLPPTT